MFKPVLAVAAIFAATTSLAACMPGAQTTAADARAADQPILCEMSFTNFAWTPTVAFTGITGDGQVLTFDSRTAEGLTGFALLSLTLSDRPTFTDLAHRYVVARPTGTVLPAEVVDRIFTLAQRAGEGAIESRNVGADMGQSALDCFVPDAGGRSFRIVTIQSDGDWEIRNTDPAAEELAALLTALLGDDATRQ